MVILLQELVEWYLKQAVVFQEEEVKTSIGNLFFLCDLQFYHSEVGSAVYNCNGLDL